MAITTYALLQTAIAGKLHRDDLTTEIQEAISLAESELQADCKLVEFEATASIVITAGTGSLPTGFVGMRSVYWDEDTDTGLEYVTPEQFDLLRNYGDGRPMAYTVSGLTLRVLPSDTGTAVATYNARFTALSDAAPSNSILTNFPDAYLYGALKHISIHTDDDKMMQKAGLLFNAVKDRIGLNNEQRKFAGGLAVRAR